MFRGRKLGRGRGDRGRQTFQPGGGKFRGALRGAGPMSARGKRFTSPYQVAKNKTQKEHPGNQKDASEDLPLYRQKMSITLDPERKFVENEIDQIKEALLDALEPLEDGYFPQFYGASLAKGMLVMSCANEQTKQWLEKIVPELKPWEGAKLRVKPKGEVTQGTKVLLKTPKLFAKKDPKTILHMLSTQNKTLETDSWKNVSVKSEASGHSLIYVVDDKSVEAIRALNNKAYLGLGNVELVILKNEEEEEGEKQTPADTEVKKDADEKKDADTEVKKEDEAEKQASEDTEMKTEEETDKQTS